MVLIVFKCVNEKYPNKTVFKLVLILKSGVLQSIKTVFISTSHVRMLPYIGALSTLKPYTYDKCNFFVNEILIGRSLFI